MKLAGGKFIGIVSCFILLATLSIFPQNPINKKPLSDFDAVLQENIKTGKVDLDEPFSVTLTGFLTKEGRFDKSRSAFTEEKGDPSIVNVVKTWMEAIDDSGIFSYLKEFEPKQIILTVSQDDKNTSVIINSELSSVEKARTMASSYNTLIVMTKMKIEDEDEKTLLNAVNINWQEKNCFINFVLPKEEAHRILKQKVMTTKAK